jgi:DNA polymerase III delta prime subunit
MSQFSESFRSRRKSAPVEYMDDEDEVPVVAQTDVGDDSPANSSVERSSVDGQAPTSWHRDLMVSHEKLLRDLEGIVGMEKIKELLIDINSKINLRKERVRRSLSSRDSGRPPTGSGMAPHIALIGNPGTGKSKIGKILARMLYRSHAVKRNILVKAHRSDLVAGFIGQTALKTAELIEQARGGILFVDEAHQLINPNKDDYGIEAYREIMKEMLSDHAVDEDRVTFIFAGYPKQMRRFLSHDAGMESRVSFRIHLPDYTLKEIGAICETKLASRDPGEGLPTRVEPGINLESMLHSLPLELVPRYNARISDLLLDKAEACLAKRMLLAPSPDESIDIFTLMAGDIRNAVVGLRNEMLQANSVNGSPDTSDADHTPKRR